MNDKTKELLEKQLELLSERSHQRMTSDANVAELSFAMAEIAKCTEEKPTIPWSHRRSECSDKGRR